MMSSPTLSTFDAPARPRSAAHRLRPVWTAFCSLLLVVGFLLVPHSAATQSPGEASPSSHASPGAPANPTEVRYTNAEQLLGWHASRALRNHEVNPNWIFDGDRFWYRVAREEGHEFMLVDPDRRERRLAFDNGRLASAMSMAADTAYDPVRLPFETFEYLDQDLRNIRIKVQDRRFECDVQQYRCTVGDTIPKSDESFVMSPDSTWEAFVHQHDLWVRSVANGDSIRLTDDGEEYWAYGLRAPRAMQQKSGDPREPSLRWSPDSRYIAVDRWDEREVEHMPMYSITSVRPQGFTYPYALPGDSIYPIGAVHVIEPQTRTNHRVEIDPDPAFISWASGMDSTWTADSERVRVLTTERGHQHAQLVEIDAATGQYRVLAVETRPTFVDLAHRGPPNWFAGEGDVIWFSQRDGWGHLYRYDRGGNLVNRITEGAWLTGHIHHVDEGAQRIYFTAWGREADRHPYYTHFYRVNFDGSGLQLLTPEDANHEVDVSPSGRYFIGTRSTPQDPPVITLRSTQNGNTVLELEEADISQAEARGWTPPESFRVKGRDGVTDIYGLLHKPSHFDPAKSYPVVNYIYPGPQIGSVGTYGWTLGTRGNVRALAELGFIVLQIDHMGSPFRSKDFHDKYYADMADHGLPDHVAAIRQLGAARPYMDLDRVGIYGHSGGGFASTAAILMYPDVFHVAVSTAGNHDNRRYGIHWGEKYQGLLERDTIKDTDNYVSQANQTYAENLEGKLFLMTGDMDDNVHPAMTYKVAHALIEANKDFDFLILPDRAHGLNEPYVIRKTWDYFVEHLRGEEPPREYVIRRPE
jgi:dipeptidyl-peptidase 4